MLLLSAGCGQPANGTLTGTEASLSGTPAPEAGTDATVNPSTSSMSDSSTSTSTDDAKPLPDAATPADRAVLLYETILSRYAVKGMDLYLERYPAQSEDNAFSYLWPLSELLSATNALGRLPGREDAYRADLAAILKSIDAYRDTVRKPPAYQAYPADFSSSVRYYDDNLWLGLDFVIAYRQTGDSQYLDLAKEIMTFAQSGWTEQLGGGIFWCEAKKKSKNTCSNGPAAVLALELYQETQDTTYLEWGKKIYNWTRKNLQAPDGLYWDNISLEGTVDKATYAYNCGTMIQAAVLLHTITGKAGYLTEAQRVAKVSFEHFTTTDPDGTVFFPPKDPWFTIVLFRGYRDLYAADGKADYMQAAVANLDYAWTHARDENGLIGRDWSGRTQEDLVAKHLLDEACLVEGYGMAAGFQP